MIYEREQREKASLKRIVDDNVFFSSDDDAVLGNFISNETSDGP